MFKASGLKFIFAGIMTAFIVTVNCTSSRAQTLDYFDLPPEQLLSAQVVSVSRRSETVAQSPAAVYVITNEDIIRSGVTNIPDALRMAPGVQVAQADSNTWAVSIRGFNDVLAKRLLVLIDGRTVYNPLHGGVYWEAHNLSMDLIDRIEVIRGPGGALWGANAVNGVINIITKKSGDTQGTQLSGGYGTHERGFAAGRYGGSFGENRFYRVYANHFNRDNYRMPNGGPSSNDEWNGYRAGFRADWSDYFTFSGDAYRTGSEQNAQQFSLTAPFITPDPETAVNKGANILGRWTSPLDNGASVMVQTYLDYSSRDEDILSDNRYIFDVDSQYNFQPLGRHEVIAGAGYRYMQDDLSGSQFTTFNPASREDSIYSAFVQDKIMLAPDEWYLTLGSKFEHHFYTGFEYQPSARLQWFPDQEQTVWASVSRAVRTPTRIERDLNIANFVLPPGIFALPALLSLANNKSFDSEKMTAYELGYRNQITRAVSTDAALFYNEYHDLLALDPASFTAVAGPPAFIDLPLVARNDASAETVGGELVLGWDVNNRWKLTATYSYLEIFMHSPDVFGVSQESDEGESPVHQASLQSSWDINRNLNLDTKLYYVDGLPSEDVDDYIRFDVNLGWQVHANLRFDLTGQNLVDEAHREFGDTASVNAAEVERSIFGKFTWEF